MLGLDQLLASAPRVAGVSARPVLAVYGISAVIIGVGSYWFLARTVLPA
jgi:hypothetical protein